MLTASVYSVDDLASARLESLRIGRTVLPEAGGDPSYAIAEALLNLHGSDLALGDSKAFALGWAVALALGAALAQDPRAEVAAHVAAARELLAGFRTAAAEDLALNARVAPPSQAFAVPDTVAALLDLVTVAEDDDEDEDDDDCEAA